MITLLQINDLVMCSFQASCRWSLLCIFSQFLLIFSLPLTTTKGIAQARSSRFKSFKCSCRGSRPAIFVELIYGHSRTVELCRIPDTYSSHVILDLAHESIGASSLEESKGEVAYGPPHSSAQKEEQAIGSSDLETEARFVAPNVAGLTVRLFLHY
jgi:hypothetical protein